MTPGKALPLSGSPQPCDAAFHQGPMHSSEIHDWALGTSRNYIQNIVFIRLPKNSVIWKKLKTTGSWDGHSRGLWGNEAGEAGMKHLTNRAKELYIIGNVPGIPSSAFLIVSRWARQQIPEYPGTGKGDNNWTICVLIHLIGICRTPTMRQDLKLGAAVLW